MSLAFLVLSAGGAFGLVALLCVAVRVPARDAMLFVIALRRCPASVTALAHGFNTATPQHSCPCPAPPRQPDVQIMRIAES